MCFCSPQSWFVIEASSWETEGKQAATQPDFVTSVLFTEQPINYFLACEKQILHGENGSRFFEEIGKLLVIETKVMFGKHHQYLLLTSYYGCVGRILIMLLLISPDSTI